MPVPPFAWRSLRTGPPSPVEEHDHHGEGRQERNRIDQEARRDTRRGQQCPSHGRAEDPGGVDNDLVQADRIGGAVLADEVEHEDLASRGVKHVDQPEPKGEDVDDPDPQLPECENGAEGGAQGEESGLRPKEDLAALEAVDERPRPRSSDQ